MMTRHCPECHGTNLVMTLLPDPTVNEASCQCGWQGVEADLHVEKTFADEFMDRLRAPPVR